jgi:transposase
MDVFVGIDVAKSRNAIAIADSERGGEVRYFGEVDAAPDAMRRAVQQITAKHGRAHFCYEAGPTGYGLYRLITGMGYPCDVVAPSLIPMRPGDRVKTNRRDAVGLAKLLRAGELIPKRNESDSLRFGQARAALEHFQGLMRQHLRALV